MTTCKMDSAKNTTRGSGKPHHGSGVICDEIWASERGIKKEKGVGRETLANGPCAMSGGQTKQMKQLIQTFPYMLCYIT
jgi:hypothetical protein